MALQQQFVLQETGLVVNESYIKIAHINVFNMECVIDLEIYADNAARQARKSPLKRVNITGVQLTTLEGQTGDNLVAKAYAFVKQSQPDFKDSIDV